MINGAERFSAAGGDGLAERAGAIDDRVAVGGLVAGGLDQLGEILIARLLVAAEAHGRHEAALEKITLPGDERGLRAEILLRPVDGNPAGLQQAAGRVLPREVLRIDPVGRMVGGAIAGGEVVPANDGVVDVGNRVVERRAEPLLVVLLRVAARRGIGEIGNEVVRAPPATGVVLPRERGLDRFARAPP